MLPSVGVQLFDPYAAFNTVLNRGEQYFSALQPVIGGNPFHSLVQQLTVDPACVGMTFFEDEFT